MKAVVYRRSVGLVFEDVPKPEVGENEVLIRVANTGFCGSDHSLVESGLVPDGYVLGHETSGVIEVFGNEVKSLKAGSRVMIRPTFCGKCRHCLAQNPHLCTQNRRTMGVGDLPGGFAEYVKVFPQMVLPIPEGVDSQSAALTETFASALHGIKRSGVKEGSALILGGGPIGLAAIQLAKFGPFSHRPFGAGRVKKISGEKIRGALRDRSLIRRPAQKGCGVDAGAGFDLALECSGVPGNIQLALDAAAKGGTVCVVSVFFKPVTIDRPLILFLKELKLTVSASNTHEENYQCPGVAAAEKAGREGDDQRLHFSGGIAPVVSGPDPPGKVTKAMIQIGEEF